MPNRLAEITPLLVMPPPAPPLPNDTMLSAAIPPIPESVPALLMPPPNEPEPPTAMAAMVLTVIPIGALILL
jgi:hypothetical protein